MNHKSLITDERAKAKVCLLIDQLTPDPLHEVLIREFEGDRSAAQNRLSFLLYNEAADLLGDTTAADVRAYCKLHLGVGILKEGTSDLCVKFREQYDETIRPLTYEQKLALMLSPIELPITSLMKVKMFSTYIEAIYEHYAMQGITLSKPPDIYEKAMGRV